MSGYPKGLNVRTSLVPPPTSTVRVYDPAVTGSTSRSVTFQSQVHSSFTVAWLSQASPPVLKRTCPICSSKLSCAPYTKFALATHCVSCVSADVAADSLPSKRSMKSFLVKATPIGSDRFTSSLT